MTVDSDSACDSTVTSYHSKDTSYGQSTLLSYSKHCARENGNNNNNNNNNSARKSSHHNNNNSNNPHDTVNDSGVIKTDGLTLRYACLSQRGHSPDDESKVNQDAFCVYQHLSTTSSNNNNKNDGNGDVFFGVFDGHGHDGDGCAQYACEELPLELQFSLKKLIQQQQRQFPPKKTSTKQQQSPKIAPANYLRPDLVHQALSVAHLETNQRLRQDPRVDASLSGTTAVSLYLHGHHRRITVANVGDSRAVLGRLSNPLQQQQHSKSDDSSRTFKALPLSYDHTPYRPDERARILATGARILSLDQLEGLEPILNESETNGNTSTLEQQSGDPPRVWSPNEEYPGTAFTRSLGDAVAEELGVFGQPELLTHDLLHCDKILVLATDGVFEFLTNQSVIDICAKFDDPLQACRAVVAEAYELWLQYELRTDDITILTVFIEHADNNEKENSNNNVTNKYDNKTNDNGGDHDSSQDNSVDETEVYE